VPVPAWQLLLLPWSAGRRTGAFLLMSSRSRQRHRKNSHLLFLGTNWHLTEIKL
jgi:hypothetical protein